MNIKALLLCASMTLTGLFASAQDYGHHVRVGAGTSLIGVMYRAITDAYTDTDTVQAQFKSLPVIAFNYGYKPAPWVRIGVQTSWQRFSVLYEDIRNNEQWRNDFDRISLTLQPDFIYAQGDRWEIYSGFKVGWQFFNNKWTDKPTSFEESNEVRVSGNFIALGIVPVGFSYYFIDNLGINADIALGGGYFAQAGLIARF